MEPTLEDLVQQAKDGNKEALESLVQRIQDRVYGLALRMLGYPADAEDAAQEILVKVVTHLDSFRQESAFTTWVYRVAANHLLTTRKRLIENQALSFEDHEFQLESELAAEWQESIPVAERSLIVQEMMLSCTQGMLLCLDRPHRITYILSEIFSISSQQGAYILDISPAAYRKRLSRARDRIQTFMLKNCALVNPDNPCHCDRVAPYAIQTKVIDPNNLLFTGHRCRAKGGAVSLDHLQELDSLQRVAALFRSHPDYAAPETFLESLKELVDSGQVGLFEGLH
ncbi:RNA polymerase sigma factor [Thermodesulfobacteriota bacterium]